MFASLFEEVSLSSLSLSLSDGICWDSVIYSLRPLRTYPTSVKACLLAVDRPTSARLSSAPFFSLSNRLTREGQSSEVPREFTHSTSVQFPLLCSFFARMRERRWSETLDISCRSAPGDIETRPVSPSHRPIPDACQISFNSSMRQVDVGG